MATFNKINDFIEDWNDNVHDFDTHVFKYALSNTAPASETPDPSTDGNGVLANVTEIAYTNIVEDRSISTTGITFSGGVLTFDGDNETLTASGGAVPEFRYIYLYNDTATGDPLIGYWDRGSGLTLADGESVNLNLATNFFTAS